MRGGCRCGNISLSWQNVDYSLVPRACGCEYCAARSAAYVSKSGTRVDVVVRKPALLHLRRHGSEQATFNECGHCGDVVFVSAEIEDTDYCAINVHCLEQRNRFPDAIDVNFSDQSPEDKRNRWAQNWCCPVIVKHGDATAGNAVVHGGSS